MARVNDENSEPALRPNTSYHARLAINKPQATKEHPRPQAPAEMISKAMPSPLITTQEPEEELEGSAGDNQLPAVASPVVLFPLVEQTLGDPDAALALVRTKPTAGKYDFKGRIAELSEQNRALKVALIQKADGQRTLAETLARKESDINLRLGEAVGAKQQLGERGKLMEDVQDALRAVLQTEVQRSPCPSSHVSLEKCVGKEESESILRLRKLLAGESAKRSRAEAIVHKREQELAAAGRELRRVSLDGDAREQAAEERARAASQLVKEAGKLLQSQVQEAAENRQDLLRAAAQREAELTSELEEARVAVRRLEAELTAHKSPQASSHSDRAIMDWDLLDAMESSEDAAEAAAAKEGTEEAEAKP